MCQHAAYACLVLQRGITYFVDVVQGRYFPYNQYVRELRYLVVFRAIWVPAAL